VFKRRNVTLNEEELASGDNVQVDMVHSTTG